RDRAGHRRLDEDINGCEPNHNNGERLVPRVRGIEEGKLNVRQRILDSALVNLVSALSFNQRQGGSDVRSSYKTPASDPERTCSSLPRGPGAVECHSNLHPKG